jgi:sugar lactone lactonase YvrE
MPDPLPTTVLHMPLQRALRWLPEGPTQISPGRVAWVAIQHGNDRYGSVNVMDLSTGVNNSFPLHGRPGFVRPTSNPRRLLLGCDQEIGLLDLNTRAFSPLAEAIAVPDRERVIINDGTLLPDGSGAVFGTKDCRFEEAIAALYLFRDGRISLLREGQTCSNGKAFRKRNGKLFLLDIDTPLKSVTESELDLDGRRLGPPQVVLDLAGDEAFPDGMFGPVPAVGGDSVLIAMYNPELREHGEVRQYSLDSGRLLQIWQTMFSPRVTCPTLIDNFGSVQLLITTAQENMSAEQLQLAPQAGAIFVGDVMLPSLPPFPAYPLG